MIANEQQRAIVSRQLGELEEWRDRVLHDSTQSPFQARVEAAGIEKMMVRLQAEIDAEPAAVDAPDRVVAGKEMAVRDLVEDELILSLPYAPRHEECEAHPEGSDSGSDRARSSPFAGLRGMMQRKH